MRIVDDAVLTLRQLELLLYGDVMHRILVYLFTDSESTLESIALLRQIATKTLRNVFMDLKKRLVDDEVMSYAWLPTNSMWADILTKEKKMPPTFEKVIVQNTLTLGDTTVNRVKVFSQEVQMTNIRDRTETQTLNM